MLDWTQVDLATIIIGLYGASPFDPLQTEKTTVGIVGVGNY